MAQKKHAAMVRDTVHANYAAIATGERTSCCGVTLVVHTIRGVLLLLRGMTRPVEATPGRCRHEAIVR